MCTVSLYNREPHTPCPLGAYHPVAKTDIKPIMQILIPDVQRAAGRVQGGVGKFPTGLKHQVYS